MTFRELAGAPMEDEIKLYFPCLKCRVASGEPCIEGCEGRTVPEGKLLEDLKAAYHKQLPPPSDESSQ